MELANMRNFMIYTSWMTSPNQIHAQAILEPLTNPPKGLPQKVLKLTNTSLDQQIQFLRQKKLKSMQWISLEVYAFINMYYLSNALVCIRIFKPIVIF